MSMRKLAPGETCKQAVHADYSRIATKVRLKEPLDTSEVVSACLALATTFAWLEKVQEHQMPLLTKEIEARADELMAGWGYGVQESEE